MSARVLNGNELSAKIRGDLRRQVAEMKAKGVNPGLAVVLVGEDEASKIYVGRKKKACEELGINSFEYHLNEAVSEEELLSLVRDLNADRAVNGILVQLPLPKHIDEEKVILEISPYKDVDAFHPANVGRIMIGNPVYLPCTPAGVMGIDQGKRR